MNSNLAFYEGSLCGGDNQNMAGTLKLYLL